MGAMRGPKPGMLLFAVSCAVLVAIVIAAEIWGWGEGAGPEEEAGAATAGAFDATAGFEPLPIEVRRHRLFDLGITDYDDDGRFDVFSLNHKFPSTFALGRGSGFVDASRRLSSTAAFPGFERLLERPVIDRDGIYLWADGSGRLHLVARDLEPGATVTGALEVFGAKVPTELERRIEVSKEYRRVPEPPTVRVAFELRSGSQLVLAPPFVDLPIEVELAGVDPSAVFVGPERVSPRRSEFELTLRDRHGAAWADLDGDGRRDAFIVRGGLSGNSLRYRAALEDEILLGRGDGALAPAPQLLGVKGRCRARDAFAADFTGDGRLDLFAACEKDNPRFYRQQPGGAFTLEPSRLKGGFRLTDFELVDLDGDLEPELVGAGGRRVFVYRRRSSDGRWRRTQNLRAPVSTASVAAILPAAIDGDGAPDLAILSPRGNTVALNDDGRLRIVKAVRLGLPRESVTGAWVDYDNDGNEDLHLVPQGIYRRKPAKLRFRPTGLMTAAAGIDWASDSWADFDGDGDREPLVAYKSGSRIEVVRFDNRVAEGSWLEVELTGPAANREAVGARVTVVTAGSTRHRWVGAAEGSRFSQGHYRTYFGLGGARRVQRVTVRWPDGERSSRRRPEINRLLEIRR